MIYYSYHSPYVSQDSQLYTYECINIIELGSNQAGHKDLYVTKASLPAWAKLHPRSELNANQKIRILTNPNSKNNWTGQSFIYQTRNEFISIGLIWNGENIQTRKTESNMTRKNSTESEPKLVKYANGFKNLVSRELQLKPNYFGYPNISESDL